MENGKKEELELIFNQLQEMGDVATKKEFAEKLCVNDKGLIKAMGGDPKYLTESLLVKARRYVTTLTPSTGDTIPVIPTGARAGTLGDFSESISLYECERIVTPIRGADYAIQVTGDSMSPEYPSGTHIIIKKIDEKQFIEWGKVYVLDTDNGAVIKQIRRTEKEDVVECVSLNPAYQPFTINTKYINGWYRVLMALSLK